MDFTFLQERAYNYLREQILSDRLEYDVIYSESQIAKEIGCSRTPVKNALTRLRHDKYIDITPSKGFVLHKFSEADIRSTFQVRMALESFCTIALMQARDTEQGQYVLSELKVLVDKQENIAKNGSYSDFLPLDLAFHRQIINFVDNDDLRELYESHNFRIEKLAAKSLQIEGRCMDTYLEHIKIFMAIHNGGISDCYQAVTVHNKSTYRYDLRILKEATSIRERRYTTSLSSPTCNPTE